MLRHLLPAAAAAFGLVAAAASRPAEAAPVVVELFTSQGCSSCPPADALLADLADRDDVIALALHVDYWDYLGWRDMFARPEHTARQNAYRDAADERSVYTPQIVVDGRERIVGSRRGEVMAAIRERSAAPHAARVTLTSMGDQIEARIEPEEPMDKPCTVWVAPYDPPQAVEIERGENRGKTITYYNVSRGWMRLGEWDGREATTLTAPMPNGARGVAVILQDGRAGPIVGAAKIEF